MKKILIAILVLISFNSFGQNKKYAERLNADGTIDSFYVRILAGDSVFRYSDNVFVTRTKAYYDQFFNPTIPGGFANFVICGDGVYRNNVPRAQNVDSAVYATKANRDKLKDSLQANISLKANSSAISNVDNTSDVNKPVSSATQTALNLKANLASPAFTGTPTGITATHVGLGNVNNTSDAAKPISTATQTALDAKLATNGSAAALTNFPTLNQNTSGTAAGLSAPLSFANGGASGSAATSATTGTMTVSMTTSIITCTPTGAITLNASGGVAGQRATFVFTTSGVSSFVITFGTNFIKVGTLATGTTTGKTFCVSFLCTNGTQWVETGRTTAM